MVTKPSTIVDAFRRSIRVDRNLTIVQGNLAVLFMWFNDNKNNEQPIRHDTPTLIPKRIFDIFLDDQLLFLGYFGTTIRYVRRTVRKERQIDTYVQVWYSSSPPTFQTSTMAQSPSLSVVSYREDRWMCTCGQISISIILVSQMFYCLDYTVKTLYIHKKHDTPGWNVKYTRICNKIKILNLIVQVKKKEDYLLTNKILILQDLKKEKYLKLIQKL